MNRVVHFEIQAEDPQRAMAFYTNVFGWTFEQWEENEYWMLFTAEPESTEPGINGGLLPRPSQITSVDCGSNAFVCTIQVVDFDAMAEKILAAGGTVALPKYALAGMAWQGYFLDTEGNTFGLHQTDPDAQ